MPAQVSLAVDNLEAVLTGAGMSFANVVRLNIYTTDVDAFLASTGAALGERTAAAGVAPPGTLLGVAACIPGADGRARGDRGRLRLTPPQSVTGGRAHITLRSPCALSMRLTGGQYLSTQASTGNAAASAQ